jgi:signal transduction histidine kinase
VVTNLVSNALRYSAEGSPVEVRVWGDTAHGFLEVVDHGIGIPAVQLPDLFSPFFRGDNAQEMHRGGLGLGLHITHEIIRRHGGKITVESTEGVGSRFRVELPRAAR